MKYIYLIFISTLPNNLWNHGKHIIMSLSLGKDKQCQKWLPAFLRIPEVAHTYILTASTIQCWSRLTSILLFIAVMCKNASIDNSSININFATLIILMNARNFHNNFRFVVFVKKFAKIPTKKCTITTSGLNFLQIS